MGKVRRCQPDQLAASDDIKASSSIVGLMDADDLVAGLAVARVGGELRAVSDVVDLMEMVVLSAFLKESILHTGWSLTNQFALGGTCGTIHSKPAAVSRLLDRLARKWST